MKRLESVLIVSLALLFAAGLSSCIQKVEKKILVSADVGPVDTAPGDTVDTTGDAKDADGEGADGTQPLATHNIGPTGGTFVFTGGLTLKVPADALPADTELTSGTKVVTRPDWFKPSSEYFEIGPTGTTFAKPVMMIIPLDKEKLATADLADFTVATSADGADPWTTIPYILDLASAKAIVQISHLSVYVAGSGHEIPCEPTEEICNGKDDNCDKAIDEDACAAGELCTGNAQCKSGTCAEVAGDSVSKCTAVKDACLLKTGDAAPQEIPDGELLCSGAKEFRLCTKAVLGEATSCATANPGKPLCSTDDKACIAECANSSECTDDGDKCNGGVICTDGECVSDGLGVECPASEACKTWTCEPSSGDCKSQNTNESKACDDKDPCTEGEKCTAGVCGGGTAKSCDDSKPCTTDSCNPTDGVCKHTPIGEGELCDDGDPCTEGEKCSGADCTGGFPKNCDDENLCTLDTCTEGTGVCEHIPTLNADCDDKNACTSDDACNDKGVCTGTQVFSCADDNDCTVDSCNPESGQCEHKPGTKGTSCKYPNSKTPSPCVTKASCDDKGACIAETSSCDCEADSDCSSKEDGNLCNGTLYCNKATLPYKCEVKSGTVVTCSTADDTDCKKRVCQPSDGSCPLTNVADNTSCDDGTVCTLNEKCTAGVCGGGTALSCKDTNPCTKDQCNALVGCEYPPEALNTPCEDGNPCTRGDKCNAASSCVSGTLDTCDDSDICTTDSCNTGTPPCNHVPVAGCCKIEADCTSVPGSKCYKNACCVPACAGKTCGDDGCGGTCGTCTTGYECDPQGKCFCAICCTGSDTCKVSEMCFVKDTMPKCNAGVVTKSIGFEDGTTGTAYALNGVSYSECAVPNPFTVADPFANTGTKSLKFTSFGKSCRADVSLTVPAGLKNPSVAFFFNCKWLSTMEFNFNVLRGATPIGQFNRDMCPATAVWKRMVFPLGSATGAQTISIQVQNVKNLTLYIDDFELISE